MNRGYFMQGLDLALELVKLVYCAVVWLYKKVATYTR